MGAVAKSYKKTYMRKGFLIYEKMSKYLVIYEEAVSHTVYVFATAPFWIFLCMGKILFSFYQYRQSNPTRAVQTVSVSGIRGLSGSCGQFQAVSRLFHPILGFLQRLMESYPFTGRPRQLQTVQGNIRCRVAQLVMRWLAIWQSMRVPRQP
jgi:hypothetical protein